MANELNHRQCVSVLCDLLRVEARRLKRQEQARRAFAANLADLIWIQRTTGHAVSWGDWWSYRCPHLPQSSAERSWERVKMGLRRHNVPFEVEENWHNSGNREVLVFVSISELEIDRVLRLGNFALAGHSDPPRRSARRSCLASASVG